MHYTDPFRVRRQLLMKIYFAAEYIQKEILFSNNTKVVRKQPGNKRNNNRRALYFII